MIANCGVLHLRVSPTRIALWPRRKRMPFLPQINSILVWTLQVASAKPRGKEVTRWTATLVTNHRLTT